MIYYTKYAENKFEILNKHKVYFTREQIEDAVLSPDKTKNKGKYFSAVKENIGVVYNKRDSVIKIITFYPVK